MSDVPTREELQAKAPYLLVSLAVLLLDQWTKWLVEAHLGRHASVEIVSGLLNFTHVRNTGVAFGLFASHGDATGTLLLLALGLVAFLFVGYYFWLLPASDRIGLWALSLVLGGAVGNLLDRWVQGGVTDFIDFYVGAWHWHTFNVADSAISVGIGLMLLGAFTAPGESDAEPNRDEDDAETAPSSA